MPHSLHIVALIEDGTGLRNIIPTAGIIKNIAEI